MSRKRPSVIEGLDLAGEITPPASETPKVVSLESRAEAPAKTAPPKPKARHEIQHTSIYVPKGAYRKIREIALTGDRKPHDVIMEGIDLVLAKYGFPSLADFKKGRDR